MNILRRGACSFFLFHFANRRAWAMCYCSTSGLFRCLTCDNRVQGVRRWWRLMMIQFCSILSLFRIGGCYRLSGSACIRKKMLVGSNNKCIPWVWVLILERRELNWIEQHKFPYQMWADFVVGAKCENKDVFRNER
jgi:hypothetical protein